jgi:ribosome maturation factor RimP
MHFHPNPESAPLNFTANSGILSDATRLSAGFFRVRTGWRRDEWAESPLFICGKSCPKTLKNQGNAGVMAAGKAAGTMAVRLDEIRKAAERVAASHGLDLVDIEFAGPAKDRTLSGDSGKERRGPGAIEGRGRGRRRGLPEKLLEGSLAVEQLSGVTHEDCAAFSRDFGVLLDVEDLIPGEDRTRWKPVPQDLDRKLTQPEDFERFQGCLVKVQTFEPVRNNRHWQGRLMAGKEARQDQENHDRPGGDEAKQQEPQGRREHGGDRTQQY